MPLVRKARHQFSPEIGTKFAARCERNGHNMSKNNQIKNKNIKYKKLIPYAVILIFVLALFFILNYIIDEKIITRYNAGIIKLMLINILLAVSLNIVTGFLGQLVLGHAGFMSIGAYTAALITLNSGLDYTLSLIHI